MPGLSNYYNILSPNLYNNLFIWDYHHTLYYLSVFSLAKSWQLILKISATYRLASYLIRDNWPICKLFTLHVICTVWRYVFFFQNKFKRQVNIKLGFCDTWKNNGLSYQMDDKHFTLTSQKPHLIVNTIMNYIHATDLVTNTGRIFYSYYLFLHLQFRS